MTAIGRHAAEVRDLAWAHPEWWVAAIGALAWVPLARHGHWTSSVVHRHTALLTGVTDWHVMVMAMMWPVMAIKARDVGMRTLAEHRHWAMAVFLVGYLIPWSSLGLAIAATGAAMIATTAWPLVVLLLGSMTWTLLPIRDRAMAASCGYTPVIAPSGVDAVRDCIRAGLIVGSWCVVGCWPLMLACAVSGHSMVLTIAGAAIIFAETLSFRPPRAFVFASVAAATALFALTAMIER